MMMVLRHVFSIFWVFICTILLICVAFGSAGWEFPVTILYSGFLVIAYGGFFILFKKSIVEKINNSYKYLMAMSILSSVCTIMIFISFFSYAASMCGVLPDDISNFLDKDGFCVGIMRLTCFFSGGGIGFILWNWIITKSLENNIFYKIAKLQTILMLISTYAFSFAGDYVAFIRHS